ncbi:phage tail protein [Caulobacter sp. BP25]|uniref:phage tail protein n=1 Tax=Caulobacter sp. BP25 TaxID=2048900 RepID=UPI000C12ACDE|nr:phage tail protein [Caulobacter sp. BP25]PHY20933.1 hypothetical protein CSW59_06915 [Caulobacter sp. BP25]
MAKRSTVRRWLAGLLASTALVFAPAVAHADPVSAAVVSFVGFVTGSAAAAAAVSTFLTTFGSIIYSTAGSWALSKLSKPKGATASQERQAQVTTLSIGEVPREMIVGQAATGGSLVDGYYYGGEHGTDWNLFVIALADHPCHDLVGFYVGDTFVEFGADGDVPGYSGQLKVWWRPGEADDADFPGEISGLGPATAPGSLRGVAKVAVAYKIDPADAKNPVWTSGRPTFLWVVKGARCYDPRKDTTVPGGAGLHRWNDPASWEWTANAEICRYAFQRGAYAFNQVGDPTKLRVGRGLSEYEAPPEWVFAPANLCDEPVDIGDGNVEPRYRVGGVIRANESFDNVEQMFADAMGGYIIQPEGGVAVDPGQAKTPVAEITDDDLVLGQPLRFTRFRSASDRVNTVVARYIEPSQKYNETVAGVARDQADIEADGGPLEETLSLPLVNSRTQALRLAEMRRRQHRLERTASITLGPRFAHLEEGDWIQWTSQRHTGGQPVVFRVTAYSLPESWQNTLALEETSFDVFGFGGLPLTIEPQEPQIPPGALTLSGVTAYAFQMEGQDQELLPAVNVGWTTPVDPAVTSIRAEIRRAGETAIAQTTTTAVNDGEMNVTNGVPINALIEVRLVPLGGPGRAIVPSAWIELVSGKLLASESFSVRTIGGLTPQQVVDELRASTQAASSHSQALLELALNALEERGQLISETYHNGVKVKRILIDEDQEWDEGDKTFWSRMNLMAVLAPDGNSMVINQDTLMWSPTESLAEHVEAVRTQIGTDIAAFNTQIRTWVNSNSAAASWITSLEVAYGGNFQAAFAQTATLASNLGGKYSLAFNVNGHASGLYLANNGTISSLIFVSSQIGFSNGGGDIVYPLAIVGGVVKATNFEADRVRAHSIVADNIVGGEITDSVASASGDYIGLSVGVWSTLRTIDYYSEGGRLDIRTQSTLKSDSTDSYFSVRVLIDGFVQDDWSTPLAGGYFDRKNWNTDATPSAGWRTIQFQAKLEPGSGSGGSFNHLMRITEHKTET